MKQLIFVSIFLGMCTVAYAQIANERLRIMNANAARANAAAAEKARHDRAALEAKWGKIGPWYSDLNWQKCTNMIGQTTRYKDRNQTELILQTNAKNEARVEELQTTIGNQEKAIKNLRDQMEAIRAKYQLQQLNSKPVVR